ncbi:uncharacterized protein LACBIDRAFT_317178 [Laccaria bicolor S238N-H82]|uniref:Predicted protein n=1 Tax=Laccaria bicolor (strain S238N-H82 / ATCC MYA-4686) TaxID=486041 RepID=B0D4K4_LACBS|nr:uncharacterized protein LACBIDRAFT_317178 [Laccaria bicolor S238N-H82]EDR10359.1 predicted protein [Laccaria bicolor S238N-H82]|eukprot:XP_001878809.1 predicted protein [Laccaria bicolor S238N-H82]
MPTQATNGLDLRHFEQVYLPTSVPTVTLLCLRHKHSYVCATPPYLSALLFVLLLYAMPIISISVLILISYCI